VEASGLNERDVTLGRAVRFQGFGDGVSGSLTIAVIVFFKINAIGIGDARFLVAGMLPAAFCHAMVLIVGGVLVGIVIVFAQMLSNVPVSEFESGIVVALPERVTRHRLFPRRAKLVIAPRVRLSARRLGEHAGLALGGTVSPFSDVRRIARRLTPIPVEHDVTVDEFAVCRVGHGAARGRGRDLKRDGRVEVDAPRLRDVGKRLRLSATDSRDGDFHVFGQKTFRECVSVVVEVTHRTPRGGFAL
jgi:hypothetical protein